MFNFIGVVQETEVIPVIKQHVVMLLNESNDKKYQEGELGLFYGFYYNTHIEDWMALCCFDKKLDGCCFFYIDCIEFLGELQ